MKADLIYQDEKSNKFWSIEVNGSEHTVTFGRIGTNGTSSTKQFGDAEAAQKAASKLIASKKKKGYVEMSLESSGSVRDSETFAGKTIKEFKGGFSPNTAVKVFAPSYEPESPVTEQLEQLVKSPDIAKLDTLVIGSWTECYENSCETILDKLIELKGHFSGLRHLFIGDMDMEDCEMSWIIQTDYSDFYQHFQALESFGVRGGQGLILGEINLPNLKNLVVETGGLNGDAIDDICNSNLPNLEHLELWLGTDEYGCTVKVEQLRPILDGKFPNLEYLGLKNYDEQDALAKNLQGAAVLEYIDVLDISMGVLKDEGAEALYNNEALLNLQHLNCRHHFISNDWMEKLSTKFNKQNINLDDQEDSDDGEWFFVEIGE